MQRFVAPLLAVLGLVLLTSCSTPPPLAGLAVELVAIERAADGTATGTVRFSNPNLVAYNLASSSHTVFLDGRPAGELNITQPMGVPPQTVVEQKAALEKTSGANLASGPASYRLDSRVVLRLYGENKRESKLRGQGTVVVQ